jgi:uncharacterized membrane protein
MIALPQIPPWDELHPLVIHFPIALLLTAPLFIIIGALVVPQRSRPYMIAALLLMVLGTAGVWFAVATGEATADLVIRNPDISAVLERHQSLAEKVRVVFTAATLLFAAIFLIPRALHRDATRLTTSIVPLVFVVAYAGAALLLANTAHQGGRLVHELGSSPPTVAQTTPATVEQHND